MFRPLDYLLCVYIYVHEMLPQGRGTRVNEASSVEKAHSPALYGNDATSRDVAGNESERSDENKEGSSHLVPARHHGTDDILDSS